MKNEWTVTTPGRLDSFLAAGEKSLTRARAQKFIKEGCVRINGRRIRKPAHPLKEGDAVLLEGDLSQVEELKIKPADLKLKVLYEDTACLVIDKPAGIAVHPGSGMGPDEKTILHGIAFLFRKKKISFSPEAVLVHRLDKETTGCLLIAKNPEAHAALQKQFEERSVRKTYLALVAGIPSPAEARIDAPIGRNLTDRMRMSILRTSVSREAQTTYKTIETMDDHALLSCDLHTGRTHQVRVHLSSIGHPILGDKTYVSRESEEVSRRHGITSLCLHAYRLRFISPVTGKEVAAEAKPPRVFPV